MRTPADLPEFFHAAGSDRVVGASQTSISAESHEGCQHLRWRVADAAVEVQPQQEDLSTAVSAAAATTAAATAARTILRFVHLQRTAAEVLAVQSLHCLGRITAGHLDKPEATRTSRLAIIYQSDRLDGAMLGEQRAQRIFVRGERKISDIEFGHGISWITMIGIARRVAWWAREY
jgi:hypothetical protein